MNAHGSGGIYRLKRSSRYWIRYSVRGKQIRESSGSTSESRARALLKRRLGEIAAGKFAGPAAERLTLGQLLDGLLTYHETNGNRSVANTKSVLRHVREFFGDDARAIDITTAKLRAYIAERQSGGAAPASIRRELAHLRTGYRLAVMDGRLNVAPIFPGVRVDNARTGFVLPADMARLVTALPPYLRGPIEFLYVTGWRSNEAKTLRWRDVDLAVGEVRLDRANSKTNDSRVTPLRGQLAEIIERAGADQRIDCQFVFHRDGKPLGKFGRPFNKAAEAAAMAGIKPHDLRRSCARNLIRAGISEQVAMMFTGHKSRSMFARYNITSSADLAQASDRLSAYLDEQQQEPAKVIPLNSSIERAHKIG